MDSTITPSGLYADVLLPVSTHFERHDVALPWYKGHYYIHRPKVIEPMGESKTDFQIFTELAYRLGQKTGVGDTFGKNFNPRADRSYWLNPDSVDEAYLHHWWDHQVKHHQNVDMPWEEFKAKGVYKFVYDEPHVAFREQIEQGKPFKTPSGKIEILCTPAGTDGGLDPDPLRLPRALHSEVDRALGVPQSARRRPSIRSI